MTSYSTTTGRPSDHAASPATLLATVVLVFASVLGVSGVGHYTGHVTGIWIANAFLLAMLMKHRRADWVLIASAGFGANVIADCVDYSLTNALLFATWNMVEILAVALPLRLFRLDRDFTRSSALLAFYALAVGPAPMMGAAMAGAYFSVTRHLPFFTTAMNWYSADALGLVIVVPPLMTVRFQDLKAMFRRSEVLWTVMLIGLLLSVILFNYFFRQLPLAFLFFPAVVLLTFQRGFAGGAVGLLMVAVYLLAPALIGESSGPLHSQSVREQVTIVQIFIAVMGFSVVLVGAALEERKALEQWLASAIKRAENLREEALVAKDSAEQANRSKSMFLANMSHELRTPLNAVIGFSEMMHSEVFGPLGDRRYREYTSLIQGAGHHLLDLINDVLDMSKIEAGKQELHREALNLSDIVRDCVEMMREQAASADVTLAADLPSAPAFIDADRRAIKQILLNLLSNAIKFTPHGGDVTAKVQRVDGNLVISVKDTGVGIPADQIYRLGNPFVQVRNNAGTSQVGTGLGLALVRALAEMHNGSLKIESVEGCGTTVNISLPTKYPASIAA